MYVGATFVCIPLQLIGGLDLIPWGAVSPDVRGLQEHTNLETFPHAIWCGWLCAGPRHLKIVLIILQSAPRTQLATSFPVMLQLPTTFHHQIHKALSLKSEPSSVVQKHDKQRDGLRNPALLSSSAVCCEKHHNFCAVMFYFNYTCRVKKMEKKTTTKNIMKQRPSLLFTHSQYNFTTYLHAQILWRSAGLSSPRCTVFKLELHDKVWFICTYTRLKYKGFNLDCNWKTQFILQCTRQLNSGCWVCVCDVSVHVSSRKETAQTLVRWQAESLYIQSSLVNKMWLWAWTGNWHSNEISEFTPRPHKRKKIKNKYPLLREMIPWSSLPANRNNSCPAILGELQIPGGHAKRRLLCEHCFNTSAVGRICCVELTAPQCKVSPPYLHPTFKKNTFTAWHLYLVD